MDDGNGEYRAWGGDADAAGAPPPPPFEDEDDNEGGGDNPGPTNNNNKREREPTMHWADTGFAGYMQAKVRKLEEQHRSHQALQPALSAIFRGVSIHVNGLTNPSHSELKQLMALHGGGFDTYFSRRTTTHIVCSALPDAKLRQLVGVRHTKAPPPIVEPEWVVASIRAGALLPTRPYEILPPAHGPQQQPLFPGVMGIPARGQAGAVQEEEGGAAAGPSSAAAAGAAAAAAAAAAVAPLRPEEIFPLTAAAAAAALEPTPAAAAAAPPPAAAAAEEEEPDEDDAAADARAQQLAARLRRECDLLKGPPRTTSDDPNFVATYFRASRLHFIGSWKARIEALMAASGGAGGGGGAPMPRATTAAGRAQPRPGSAPAPTHERLVLHVDLDAFFATASSLGRPEFDRRPLAVGHSAAEGGSGEISSANYLARKSGVRAGMGVGEALRRCPRLVVVPYEFERYEDLSERFYRCLVRRSGVVEPLSVDEAFVDVTGLTGRRKSRRKNKSKEARGDGGGGDEDKDAAAAAQAEEEQGDGPPPPNNAGDDDDNDDGVEAFASDLRAEIARVTGGCTASVGIGPNKLLARLATRQAKPDGQRRVRPGAEALAFLASLPVGHLPGVGWSLKHKLSGMGVETVAQLRSTSRAQLATKLGKATGEQLWRFAHGLDDRPVQPPAARRSVGAEVNWGVRLSTDEQARQLTADIAREVAARAGALGGGGAAAAGAAGASPAAVHGGGGGGVRARCVTLKIKRRAAGAEDLPPHKFLGHGLCDNLSKSVTLARAVSSADEVAREALALLAALAVPPRDIRGVGVMLSKLETVGGGAVGSGALGGAAALLAREQRRQDEAAAAAAAAAAGGGGGEAAQVPAAAAAALVAAGDETPPKSKRSLFRSPPPPPAPSPARGGGMATVMGPPPPRPPPQAVVPLPPASQLDPEVLAALPLAVRRELEAEYRRPLLPGGGGGRGRAAAAAGGGGRAPSASGSKGARVAAAAPQRAAPPFGLAAAAVAPSARTPSLSQIDPDTFAELPEDVQRELLAELQPRKGRFGAGGGGGGVGGGSPGGAGAAAATTRTGLALQRRAQELRRAQREALEPPIGLRVAPLVVVAAPGGEGAAPSSARLAFAVEPWPAVRAALSGALDACTRDNQGDGRRLAVLSEWLAQWLLACVHGGGACGAVTGGGAALAAAAAPPDLEAAAACLRLLRRRAAASAALRPHADALEALVRDAVREAYGFELCV